MSDISKAIVEIINTECTKYDKLAQILKLIVQTCNIDQKRYLILGSYAIRAHREINDLDINMDSAEFSKLHKLKDLGKVDCYNNQIRYFFDMTNLYNEHSQTKANFSIEIFQKDLTDGFPNEQFSLQKLKSTNNLLEDSYGHQHFDYHTLLSWKELVRRTKDIPDILLLKNILNTNYKLIHAIS